MGDIGDGFLNLYSGKMGTSFRLNKKYVRINSFRISDLKSTTFRL